MGLAVLTLIFAGICWSNISLLELGGAALLLAVAGYFFITLDTGHRYWRYTGLMIGLGGLLLIAFAAGDNLLTVLVGVVSGLVLVAIGRRGDRDLNLFTLNFLAFMVGLNAITDAWILFRIVSSDLVPHNDASSMAREVAFSAQFWAATWIILAMACWAWPFGSRLSVPIAKPRRALPLKVRGLSRNGFDGNAPHDPSHRVHADDYFCRLSTFHPWASHRLGHWNDFCGAN